MVICLSSLVNINDQIIHLSGNICHTSYRNESKGYVFAIEWMSAPSKRKLREYWSGNLFLVAQNEKNGWFILENHLFKPTNDWY